MSKARTKSWADGRRKTTTNAGQHREGEAGASTLVARSLCRPSIMWWKMDGRCRKTLCPISSLFWDKLDMEQWTPVLVDTGERSHKARWNAVETSRDWSECRGEKHQIFRPCILPRDEVPSRPALITGSLVRQ